MEMAQAPTYKQLQPSPQLEPQPSLVHPPRVTLWRPVELQKDVAYRSLKIVTRRCLTMKITSLNLPRQSLNLRHSPDAFGANVVALLNFQTCH